MSEEIRLDKGDVTVEEAIEECGECTATLPDAGHWVVVDFRSAGMTQRFGPYCQECADELAQRIRDGLPASPPVGLAPSDGHARDPQGAAGQGGRGE